MDHISRKCRATPEVRSACLHASGWGYLFHPHANTVAPDPESSSPYAQQPATGPYPESTQSTPRPPSQYSYPILPSTRRSSEWFLSFRIPRQNLVHFSVPFHACHMPRPPHPLHFICSMIFGDEYKLRRSSLCNFYSPPISSLFGPNILLRTLFSNTLSLCSYLNVRDQVLHPYKTDRITVSIF
jgi:hypothetical protein